MFTIYGLTTIHSQYCYINTDHVYGLSVINVQGVFLNKYWIVLST